MEGLKVLYEHEFLRIAEAVRYCQFGITFCPDDIMHRCNCSYQLFFALQLLRVHVVVEPLSPILHFP
jgi:hypothetical protein